MTSTINILLVEDDDSKAAEVMAELNAHGPCDVVRVRSMASARESLTAHKFDLGILDVVIPRFDNRASASPENGLELLREVHESTYLNRPRYIVGLTGHLELVDASKVVFDELVWTLLTFDRGSQAWRASLQSILEHLRRISAQEAIADYETDVCVITALKNPELSEVLAMPWNWLPSKPLDAQTFVHHGRAEYGDKSYSIVAAHAPRMGMVPTALLTTKLIAQFRPKIMVMLGICAGLRDKVALGDLIAATVSWDWQSGKHATTDGRATFQFEPDFVPASDIALSCVNEITDSERVEIFGGDESGTCMPPPEVRLAPMATGSAVLSDKSILDKIVLQNRKVLGFDMECYGFYSAALRSSHPLPHVICIKGVSDFGDESKGDDVQQTCARNSAKLMGFMLSKYGDQLVKH